MYNPEHFRETRQDVLHALIDAHPLSTLVTQRTGGMTADHLPLLRATLDDGTQVLRGHVARANPVHRELASGASVLVIFSGPQAYITPSWYPSKQEHGRVVPTWNYSVVHVHGRIRFIDDARWLHDLVARLTDRHESPRPAPWQVSDAPDDYIERMLSAIVGLEIHVETIEGKFKQSQNRDARDRAGVATGLALDAVMSAAPTQGESDVDHRS
jgi:transcriptional regulator